MPTTLPTTPPTMGPTTNLDVDTTGVGVGVCDEGTKLSIGEVSTPFLQETISQRQAVYMMTYGHHVMSRPALRLSVHTLRQRRDGTY